MTLQKAALLVVAAWPAMALADEARCPAENAGSKLQMVTVFDGPLSENASLVPDSIKTVRAATRSEWSVAYIFKDGRPLFVSCGYGKAKPVVLKPPRVKTCTFDLPRKGTASFSCK